MSKILTYLVAWITYVIQAFFGNPVTIPTGTWACAVRSMLREHSFESTWNRTKLTRFLEIIDFV